MAIEVGEYTYGVPAVRWWGEHAGLRIGKFCSIARDVTILLGGNHRVDWISTFPFTVTKPWRKHTLRMGHPSTRGDVVIGNDVWLAEGATILSSVHIGDGAVVACHAVVARDVPPYTIVAGNPARHVSLRFTQVEMDRLLEMAWWDWPQEKIVRHLDALLASDPAVPDAPTSIDQ